MKEKLNSLRESVDKAQLLKIVVKNQQTDINVVQNIKKCFQDMIYSFLNIKNFSIFKTSPSKNIQHESTFFKIEKEDEKYILPVLI